MMRKTLLLLAVLLASCNRAEPGTETRTFVLKHLSPQEAMMLIEPYTPGGATKMRATERPSVLTVAAPTSRLEQIADVLAKHDVPTPNVRLTFQLIEADGFTGKDPAIADVEEALRSVFRFQGYRLVSEAVIVTGVPATFQQSIAEGAYSLVGNVPTGNTTEGYDLEVALRKAGYSDNVLSTSLKLPNDQVVVIGSSRPEGSQATLILVVRTKVM